MNFFRFHASNIARNASLAFLVSTVLVGCGGVVELGGSSTSSSGHGGGAPTTTGSQGSAEQGSASTSGTGTGSGGAASGCPTADGVSVVGCGFAKNLALVDVDGAAAYVLDAVETDPGSYYETLWRLDLTTHEHLALYSGIALAAPIDRVLSFVLRGDAIYGVTLEDSAIIKRIPTDGKSNMNVVFAGVKMGSRLAAEASGGNGFLFELEGGGIARSDALGNVTPFSTLGGTLVGTSAGQVAIVSNGVIHLTDGTVESVLGSVTPFGEKGARYDGGRVLVPVDAGAGGVHGIDEVDSLGEHSIAHVPDGMGGGPPRFIVNGALGGEITTVFFLQGSPTGGRLFATAFGDPIGLGANVAPLGGGQLLRGFVRSHFAAGASTTEGGNPNLEGAIVSFL